MASVYECRQKRAERLLMHVEHAGAKCSVRNGPLIARQRRLGVVPATEAAEVCKQVEPLDQFLFMEKNPQTAKVKILKKRSDFLSVARGIIFRTRGFHLQANKREGSDEKAFTRVGFTCSKKVGNAVARNRAKRRLREVARLLLTDYGRLGWDYVMIGKAKKTAELSFADLCDDFKACLSKFHQDANAKK